MSSVISTVPRDLETELPHQTLLKTHGGISSSESDVDMLLFDWRVEGRYRAVVGVDRCRAELLLSLRRDYQPSSAFDRVLPCSLYIPSAGQQGSLQLGLL